MPRCSAAPKTALAYEELRFGVRNLEATNPIAQLTVKDNSNGK